MENEKGKVTGGNHIKLWVLPKSSQGTNMVTNIPKPKNKLPIIKKNGKRKSLKKWCSPGENYRDNTQISLNNTTKETRKTRTFMRMGKYQSLTATIPSI